jgi:hypothetical protein
MSYLSKQNFPKSELYFSIVLGILSSHYSAHDKTDFIVTVACFHAAVNVNIFTRYILAIVGNKKMK